MRDSTAEIEIDDGSQITANILEVEKRTDRADDDNYVEFLEVDLDTLGDIVLEGLEGAATVVGEVICAWGLFCDAEGAVEGAFDTVRGFTGNSDTATTTSDQGLTGTTDVDDIDFNADVEILSGAVSPELEIDATGRVVAADNVTVRDSNGLLISEGETITTNAIVVDNIINDSPPGSINISSGGALTGNSVFTFNTAFDEVSIINHSTKTLIVKDIEVVNTSGGVPTVTVSAQTSRRQYL